MAHDPRREDYQRLSLRFAEELDKGDPADAARAFASFGRRFAQDRDGLPQTDADRAFHLVAMASDVVDRRLPFASDEQAPDLIKRGKELLEEALRLDPACHDATRMLSSSRTASIDERYRFLSDHADEVRASCEQAREQALGELSDERAALAADIAMRPYWRWLASLAEEALICGRNRVAIDVSERLLASDPRDTSDVRFTLAYALAKLEDLQGWLALTERYPALASGRPADDAWILLAGSSLAFHSGNPMVARTGIEKLLRRYPGGAAALIRQVELPDGEFARLRVTPYSEDELILAVSEGIVLLQEGTDRSGRGTFGAWVAREAARIDPKAAREAMAAREGGQQS